jgi:aldehyde dehydrogenase (NAD+)
MTTTAETMHGLFIGGEWVTGTDVADDVNPSDIADVVGRYARGDA